MRDSHAAIRVVIGGFEPAVGRGLRALVADDDGLALATDAIGVSALSDTLTRERPDVAIIDLDALATARAVREISTRHPDTRVVVLAEAPTPTECRQMLAFGASACLSKSTAARDVLHAVHLAASGLQVLPRTEGADGDLSDAEASVLDLLRRGHSNAETAEALALSVDTVRGHARRIYRKLGVTTRREPPRPR